MKLTESKLKQIIAEELQKVITEQEILQEESPLEAMRRLASEAGGFSKLMDLPKTDRLRVDFRKAFRARRAGKKTVDLGRPASGADLASLDTPEAGLTGRKKARKVEKVPNFDDERQAAKQRRKAKREKELAAAQARRERFAKQQAADKRATAVRSAKIVQDKSPLEKVAGAAGEKTDIGGLRTDQFYSDPPNTDTGTMQSVGTTAKVTRDIPLPAPKTDRPAADVATAMQTTKPSQSQTSRTATKGKPRARKTR